MALISVRHFLALILLCFTYIRHTHCQKNNGDEGQLDPFLRPLRLEDLSPNFEQTSQGDDDFSPLDLRMVDSYLWGNPPPDGSQFSLANMTMFASEQERIISVERFASLLESVECREMIALKFKSKAAFQYAREAWNWLDNGKDRVLVLVTDNAGCAPKDERKVYHVTSAEYDEGNLVVSLDGEAKEWKDAARDIDLGFATGKVWSQIAKREVDLTGDFPLDIDVDLSGVLQEDEEHLYRLACVGCGPRGAFQVTLTLRLRWFEVAEASLEVTPDNLRAEFGFEFESNLGPGQGPVSGAYQVKDFKTITLPWPRFKIPGIIGLSGSLSSGIATVISNIEGTRSTMKWGLAAAIPDDAVLRVDLADSERNEFSGWGIEFEGPHAEVSGKMKGSVGIGPVVSLTMDFDLLGLEFDAGLQIKFPDTTVAVDGYGTKGTTCPRKGKEGTSLGLTAGVYIAFKAGVSDSSGLSVHMPIMTEPIWSTGVKRSLDGPEPELDIDGVSMLEPRGLEKRDLFVGGSIQLPIYQHKSPIMETCLPPKKEPPPPPPSPSPKPPHETPPDRPVMPGECLVHGDIGLCVTFVEGCERGFISSGYSPTIDCEGTKECCLPYGPDNGERPGGELCKVGFAIGVCLDDSVHDCVDGYFDDPESLGTDRGCPDRPSPKRCCIDGKRPGT